MQNNRIAYNRRTDIDYNKVVLLYKSGLSAKKISKRFACTDITIYNILKRMNIKRRTYKNCQKRTIKNSDIDKISNEYAFGDSAYKIGKRYSVTEKTIRKTLRKNNIPIRTSRESQLLSPLIHTKYNKEQARKRMLNGGAIKALKGNKRTNTLPHRIFRNLLINQKIPFKEEYVLENKSYDFRVYDKILVEVDGDYWHSNPDKYTKLNNTQQINKINDKIKNLIAIKNGFILLRIWESELKK